MGLRVLDSRRHAGDGDIRVCLRLPGALTRNTDGDTKLGLELTPDDTLAADELPMLIRSDLQDFGHLVLLLGNDLFNGLDDLVDDVGSALHDDVIRLGCLVREADQSSQSSAVIRSTGFDDDIPENRTCNKSVMCARYQRKGRKSYLQGQLGTCGTSFQC